MLTDEHEHAMKVAEQAYSAGNLVTCDGYYEFDLDAAAAVIAADRAGLVARIERLREALHEGKRAIGDHSAPDDCYATGPLTGNNYRDLVECPACSFIAVYEALKGPDHD
jgi:hypothetical protein